MPQAPLFTRRHCTAAVIMRAVRRYPRDALSHRDVEGLMRQRGVAVAHTAAWRWAQRHALGLEKRCRPLLKVPHDPSRVAATAIKVKQHWPYLDRAADPEGSASDFMRSVRRDAAAAARCSRKALRARQAVPPRVITGDSDPAYPLACEGLQQEGILPAICPLRPCQDLNQARGQDHRFVKRRGNAGLGCGVFAAARRASQSCEALHMIRTGQLEGIPRGMSSRTTQPSTVGSDWLHSEPSLPLFSSLARLLPHNPQRSIKEEAWNSWSSA
jgi:transposase, IS6 family